MPRRHPHSPGGVLFLYTPHFRAPDYIYGEAAQAVIGHARGRIVGIQTRTCRLD
jgi:hypothetical protein